jgi:hypothetical protein
MRTRSYWTRLKEPEGTYQICQRAGSSLRSITRLQTWPRYPKTIGCERGKCEYDPLVTPQQVHLPRDWNRDAIIPAPWQLNAIDTKVLTATLVKRRGKSMFPQNWSEWSH